MIACRACSLKTSDFTSIYSKRYDIALAEMLQSLVQVQIPEPSDGLLMVMCADCVEKTIDAYQFVQLVLRADSWWTCLQPLSDSTENVEDTTSEIAVLKVEDNLASGEVVEYLSEDFEDFDGVSEVKEEVSSEPETTAPSRSSSIKHVKYFPTLANGECSYRCCGRKCLLTFSSQAELEAHGAATHGVRQRALVWDETFLFECTVCFTRFQHRKNLMKHLRRLVRDYQCPVCGICFDRPRQKLVHMTNYHPEYLRKVARKSYRLEAQTTKICCGCGERFGTMEKLLAHSAKRHSGGPQLDQNGSEAKPNFQCNICYKRFKSQSNLQFHQRSKYLEKPFTCGQCGEAFVYRSLQEAHEQTHATERNFVCETCGAAFKTKVGLVGHVAMHRERKFQCTECDYRAVSSSRLTSHMMRHSDKMPFGCPQCPKHFRSKSNLASHMRSHVGEKSFPCRYCDRRYVYVSDRAKHERTHTGILPHGCEGCGKKFLRPCLLRTHIKVCKKLKYVETACD